LSLLAFALSENVFAQSLMIDYGRPGKQNLRAFAKQSMDASTGRRENQRSDQLDALLYLPVCQNEDSTYALVGKAQHLRFPNLKANTNFVPVSDLYNDQVGVAWSQRDEDNNTWGLNANFGSASNRPFSGSDVTAIDATITRKYETSMRTSWLIFLNYSNNRSFLNNVPIPGFAYIFANLEKTQGGVIGLPFFSYWWRLTEDLSMSLFLLVPSTAQWQIGYMLGGPFQFNLKAEYGQETFLRSNRTQRDEQIFYEAAKAAASLKSYFGATTFIELEFSRLFFRSLYDGESVFDLISDRMRLPDEWQGSASLQMSF
jgi:hypothetical protein